MKAVRIRQLEKVVRGLQADGYQVKSFVNTAQRRLVIHIKLGPDEGDEIMAQWNDLKRVAGS